MRVIHVVPAISEEASGPSYSVVRLCESLNETGADAQLAALAWGSVRPTTQQVKTFPLGFGPRRLGASPSMHRWLEQEATSGQVNFIHNHSLWMMPNVYPGLVCRPNSRCGLVVSPRGTLSAWALGRNAVRKKVFWTLLQKRALRHTVCFHATAETEYHDIRRLGFTQPVCIIPNGIDLPPRVDAPREGRQQLLFLGRIHPVKGVDILLRAWGALEGRFRDWELHVAGPDERGYLGDMQALAAQLGLRRVVFRGPLYGDAKLRAYRAADLFVLPTHSENFGVTVAESLASGTPAIVTQAAPWSGLAREGAGWWIEIGVDPLVACLEMALATPRDRLAEMGRAGREWMIREHSWGRIGQEFLATYNWLREGGETPRWVNLG
jgi:glycosyltransferase involved in cell wall biosynthesis